ncbi:MAG: leucine-rich repeat domain-containing protein, partial [Pseudomonadota bacterium]
MTDAEKAYAAAEKAIAKAKREGATELRFDGLRGDKWKALETLPPQIANLDKLETLDLSNTQVADIAPLAGLSALQELYLNRTQVADIAPLAGLSALQELDLTSTQVADIAPLAGLSALQTLRLDNTQNADIGPLAGLSALQTLALRSTQVADIAPLASLSALRQLFIPFTKVAEIGPLAGLTNLENLHLNRIPVSDIAPLADLSSLRILLLSDTSADLTALTAPGAAWAEEDLALRDLEFQGHPMTEEGGVLARLYEQKLSNKDRTAEALRRLREEVRRRPPPEPPAPPEPKGSGPDFVVSANGPVRLGGATLSSADAEQEALKAELIDLLSALGAGLEGSNQFYRLKERAERYQRMLDQPTEDIRARGGLDACQCAPPRA